MLKAFIHEVDMGKRSDNGFKRSSWQAVLDKVSAVSLGQQSILTIGHIQTKYKNFKRD